MKKILRLVLFIFLICFLCLSTSCASKEKYTHKNFFKLIEDSNKPYQLHEPIDKINENEERKYPVLIHLHGRGENNNTFSYPFFHKLLSGYALINDLINKINDKPDYYESYVVLVVEDGDWGPDADFIAEIIDLLINKKDADPNRIYITGVSMGSFATSDFIFAYPDIPACAVMICGCSYNADKAPDILNIPVRLYHSDDDHIVNVDTSRDFYSGLTALGGNKIEYFECTGYRHSAWDYAYKTDMLDWMYLQEKGN